MSVKCPECKSSNVEDVSYDSHYLVMYFRCNDCKYQFHEPIDLD
ncbi:MULTISPECIES: hypothetical protein [Methanobacterium]|nr:MULTISPECIES: hypothetical protein [Methanobacterium]